MLLAMRQADVARPVIQDGGQDANDDLRQKDGRDHHRCRESHENEDGGQQCAVSAAHTGVDVSGHEGRDQYHEPAVGSHLHMGWRQDAVVEGNDAGEPSEQSHAESNGGQVLCLHRSSFSNRMSWMAGGSRLS